MPNVWEWHPERFTRGYRVRPVEDRLKDLPYSLLVLNVPIQDRNYLMNLGRLGTCAIAVSSLLQSPDNFDDS